MRTTLVAAAIATVLVGTRPADAEEWTPQAWANGSTVELRTTDAGEPPHWSPVWFVVLDGQCYVRLGSRAAGRFDRNTTKPMLGVRIAGKTFEHVRGVVMSEMAEKVAAAMAQKYWGDLLVAFVHHPYTLQLEPEPGGGS